MDTKLKTREQVSALADGELEHSHLDQALAALRDADVRADWELYHRIGDALRSEEVADVPLSEGFAARLSARLEAEPAIIAPLTPPKAAPAARPNARRWALPGLAAAAAMAGIAFVTTPQLMVALNGKGSTSPSQEIAAELKSGAPVVPVAAGAAGAALAPEAESGAVVLRDARIDDYLLAHQRFSPSVYSSAQYARSATPPAQSDK